MTSALLLASTLLFVPAASSAQTLTVLHNFTGGGDGGSPYAGLSIDRAGNLYGTAAYGGRGFGTVFELAPKNSAWLFHLLYSFAGGNDGEGPTARVIMGPNDTLYGTTYAGGNPSCSGGYGCGTIYNLRPPATFCHAVLCSWSKTVLYRFNGGNDGANPLLGDLLFDRAGNIYGTTENGGGTGCGGAGCGTVFELSPVSGGWTEGLLYGFSGHGGDGANPYAGVIQDSAGNLYGTTKLGGSAGDGTVFRLARSGSGWTETVLHSFQGQSDGYWPLAGLVFDSAGNLYGATTSGGANSGGILFSLTTSGNETVVYSLTGVENGGPYGSLTMDGAGNFYGVAYDDGAYGNGSIFKLSPTTGGWTYTDLYDFTGGNDGRCPYGGVVIDAAGNLYGTAEAGGVYDYGVVWELTP